MKQTFIHAGILLMVSLLTGCASRSPARVPAGRAPAPLEALRSGLDRIFSDPIFAAAQWGVEVLSLDRGELLYARNSDKLFIPASNNKLLTAAVALLRLGPDFRFETRVCTDGQVIEDGLRGNLIIFGSGDPALSPRFSDGDSLVVFRRWAAKLKELGIRRIEGDLVGVDGAFEERMLGRNWAWDDLAYGYAAPISALQYHDNLVTVTFTPAVMEGDRASAKLDPALSFIPVECLVTTGPPGTPSSVTVERGTQRGGVILRGSVPFRGPPVTQDVSVDNPALFFMHTLRDTLVSAGIEASSCLIRVDALPGYRADLFAEKPAEGLRIFEIQEIAVQDYSARPVIPQIFRGPRRG